MTDISLMDQVREELQISRRPAALRVIAERADVKYEWLCKFTHGHFEDPGIRKVERIRDALADMREPQ